MGKLIESILLGILFWMCVRGILRGLLEGLKGPEAPAGPRPVPPAERPVQLVSCAHCGVYVPLTRALRPAAGGTAVYCSEGCLAAGSAGERVARAGTP